MPRRSYPASAPPWARLIHDRRVSRHPALSMSQAAALAGVSPQTWANVEYASKRIAPGVVVPWRGEDSTVAHMCLVLGITPAAMAEKGRTGVAERLAMLEGARPSARARSVIAQAAEAVASAVGVDADAREQIEAGIIAAVDRVTTPAG